MPPDAEVERAGTEAGGPHAGGWGWTCTTAPGHVFESRAALAAHYQSDWHAYNLRRRRAGLPALPAAEFAARLRAAEAARREQEALARERREAQRQGAKKHRRREEKLRAKLERSVLVPSTSPETAKDGGKDSDPIDEAVDTVDDDTANDAPSRRVQPEEGAGSGPDAKGYNAELEDADAPINIDPCQSLFDQHVSATLEANVDHMRRRYDFFIPDADSLADLEGLLGYCHEKVQLGHLCLTCHAAFGSAAACRAHMRARQHTQLAYLTADDQAELAVFYDFEAANREFLHGLGAAASDNEEAWPPGQQGKESLDDNESDGWEDISEGESDVAARRVTGDDDDHDDDVDDDDLYAGYEAQVAQLGFSVTALGELVFPDGRIVGHRALRRYYRQRPRPQTQSAAVAAARDAANERLYQGRVYNVSTALIAPGRTSGDFRGLSGTHAAAALARLGIAPGTAAGRAGRGLLVPAGPDGGFSQLSVYRYRAAVRKHRRGLQRGQRLLEKTSQNMNHMDKKHNRLMTGVSVAHAKR